MFSTSRLSIYQVAFYPFLSFENPTTFEFQYLESSREMEKGSSHREFKLLGVENKHTKAYQSVSKAPKVRSPKICMYYM